MTLASDLLDLNRIDGDGSAATTEPVELARRLRDDVPFELRADGPVHALADSAAVLRILGILVDNARVHGGGTITVALGREDDRAVVAVDDEGPGLPDAGRERLFDRWVRGADAQGRPGRVSGSRSRAGWPRRWTASCARPAARAWSCVCARGATTRRRPARGTPTGLADGRGTNVAASTASSPTTTEATKAAV